MLKKIMLLVVLLSVNFLQAATHDIQQEGFNSTRILQKNLSLLGNLVLEQLTLEQLELHIQNYYEVLEIQLSDLQQQVAAFEQVFPRCSMNEFSVGSTLRFTNTLTQLYSVLKLADTNDQLGKGRKDKIIEHIKSFKKVEFQLKQLASDFELFKEDKRNKN